MLNVRSTLTHMNISADSVSRALAELRGRLSRASSISGGATRFIKELLDEEVKFDSDDMARITAAAVLESVIRSNGEVPDPEQVIKAAHDRASTFLNEPLNAWMFVKDAVVQEGGAEEVAVVDGVSTKVTVKANGKIKKGGKQVLALELYRKHMVESSTPVSNTEFVNILVRDLGMTLAGARTYAYNVAKAHKNS